MKDVFNVSGASHGVAGISRKISSIFASAWKRVSAPILIGQFWGAAHSDETNDLADLRSVMPWNTMPGMFSGRPEPQKSTWVAVRKGATEEMKHPNIYIAIVNPVHIRKNSYERSLLCPLIRIW